MTTKNHIIYILSLSLTCCFLFLFSNNVQADTVYTVDQTECDALNTCDENGCSLVGAIDAAYRNPSSSNIIQLPAGIIDNCPDITLMNFAQPVTLQGAGMSTTIIRFSNTTLSQNSLRLVGRDITIQDLSISQSYHGIYLNSNASASIENVNIFGGTYGINAFTNSHVVLNRTNVFGNSFTGIHNYEATIEISDSTISNNSSYNILTSGTMTLDNSSILNSSIGIRSIASPSIANPSLTITNSQMSYNSNVGVYSSSGTMDITDSEISSNAAGLYILNQDATIDHCDIFENTSSGIYTVNSEVEIADSNIFDNTFTSNAFSSSVQGGAGIAITQRSVVTILRSDIKNNLSYKDGGGIYFDYHSQVDIIKSTFSGNIAKEKGGAFSSYFYGELMVTESTFTGNTAKLGAVYYSPNAETYITNSTFIGNTISDEGASETTGIFHNQYQLYMDFVTIDSNTLKGPDQYAIYTDRALSYVHKSIITNNTYKSGRLIYKSECNPYYFLGEYNVTDDDACVKDPTDIYQTMITPLVLADNGGATLTAAINGSHPAYNMIPKRDCTDSKSNIITSDQRNYARPFDNTCDAGAYEIHK